MSQFAPYRLTIHWAAVVPVAAQPVPVPVPAAAAPIRGAAHWPALRFCARPPTRHYGASAGSVAERARTDAVMWRARRSADAH